MEPSRTAAPSTSRPPPSAPPSWRRVAGTGPRGSAMLDAEYRGVRDDLGRVGRVPAQQVGVPRPRRPGRRPAGPHQQHPRAWPSARSATAASCDADGLMVDDGTVYRLRRPGLGDDQRVGPRRALRRRHRRARRRHHAGHPGRCPTSGCRAPGPARPWPRSARVDISRLGYFRFVPEPTTVGGVPCVVSRTGFGGELGFELFCRPEHAADLWDVVVNQMQARAVRGRAHRGPAGRGRPHRPRLRLRGRTSARPYDLSLDKMVALGKVDFLGRDALAGGGGRPAATA